MENLELCEVTLFPFTAGLCSPNTEDPSDTRKNQHDGSVKVAVYLINIYRHVQLPVPSFGTRMNGSYSSLLVYNFGISPSYCFVYLITCPHQAKMLFYLGLLGLASSGVLGHAVVDSPAPRTVQRFLIV